MDKDIRQALLRYLEHTEPSAAIFHEFSLCRRAGRADCAVVNGALWGYEIKSERDTLARLTQQVENYETVFDYCCIVAASRHIQKIRATVPRRWGIFVALGSDLPTIEILRKPRRNNSTIKSSLIRLMWKPEIVRLLRGHNLDVTPSTSIGDLWDHALRLPHTAIADAVKSSLTARAVKLTAQQQILCGG